ncbi:MAG: hypothetical protein IKE15_09145 [Clostridia bacterium]|nr:hypothetical protein [Clostridia bacterium]
MKKRMLILAAVLLAICILLGFAGAEAPAKRDLILQLVFSSRNVQAGETVQVYFSATNASGKDFPGAMTLEDPKGKKIKDFGAPVLKSGTYAYWFGSWTVTEKDLEAGKITFTVRYSVEDENGEIVKKVTHVSRGISAAQPEASPEPTPEPKPEDFDDVILYGVYRPNPSTGWVAVGCIDAGGTLWLAERADVPWPARDKDVREMLRTRRGMKSYGSLVGTEADGTLMNDAWFSSVVPDMISAIPQSEGKPRKTGIDVGQEGVWALRKNESGEEESVLLGMAGSYMYENPSPDAQRLYLFMWRQMSLTEIFNARGISYATEAASPQGFRGVTVREFFGLSDGDFSRASVSAVFLDADSGPETRELSPEGENRLRALADYGMVIRKENVWKMPEDVLTCSFTDQQGNSLGEIRLFTYTVETDEDEENVLQTLAVADDGMYRISPEPRPVDGLTEEELRMMTVRIEGVDYIVGKSTPRDLVRNGWNCFPELSGAFTFQDPEWNSMIEVTTFGGTLDEPIIYISCQFAYEADIEYCGYDGIIDPDNPDDPDRGYFEGEPDDEPGDEDPDESRQRHWTALTGWIHDVIGADQDTSIPGTSVCCPLSDGRYLYLFSNSSPVSISLSEYGPDDL